MDIEILKLKQDLTELLARIDERWGMTMHNTQAELVDPDALPDVGENHHAVGENHYGQIDQPNPPLTAVPEW